MRRMLAAAAAVAGFSLIAPSGALAAAHLFAALRGGTNETPAGDPNGRGAASVSFRGTDLTQV